MEYGFAPPLKLFGTCPILLIAETPGKIFFEDPLERTFFVLFAMFTMSLP